MAYRREPYTLSIVPSSAQSVSGGEKYLHCAQAFDSATLTPVPAFRAAPVSPAARIMADLRELLAGRALPLDPKLAAWARLRKLRGMRKPRVPE